MKFITFYTDPMTDKITVHEDEHGNKLYIKSHFNLSQRTIGTIHYKPKDKKGAKLIAQIDHESGTLFINRETEKHYDFNKKGYQFPSYVFSIPLLSIQQIQFNIDGEKSFKLERSVIEPYITNTNHYGCISILPFKVMKNYKLQDEPQYL